VSPSTPRDKATGCLVAPDQQSRDVKEEEKKRTQAMLAKLRHTLIQHQADASENNRNQ